MMPFVSHVILTLFGKRYEVLRFRYGFHRVTDARGRPTTGVRGGEIIVDVESTSDVSAHENIFEYGFPRSVPGSLEVWNRDETHCFRRIEWSEACIFEVGEAMARHGWEPMTMRLAITPLRLDFDRTIRIDRRWPETYGIWWEKYKPKEKAKAKVYERSVEELYVRGVKGDSEALPGQEVKYEVTRYSKDSGTVNKADRDKVVWAVLIGGKTTRLKIDGKEMRGEKISFNVPEEWTGKEVTLMPYLHSPEKDATEKGIKIKTDSGGIWINYEGGRLLYTAGMAYHGNDPFVKSTIEALNQLSRGKFGGFMIGQLQNSEFRFNISQGENIASPNFGDSKMKYDGNVYLTGANITWDGNKMINLGHELTHGFDIMNGYDISQFVIDERFGIPEGEVRAVHMENILRVEQGMSLRTHYSPLNEPPVLVGFNGEEVRFGYDYKNSTNIPWNYGNGIYDTCRTSTRIMPSKPASISVKPIAPLKK